jgi:prepilin-type N-terminal cleavage/methylation domain-containing protein
MSDLSLPSAPAQSRDHDDSGISLIEVVVAMMLLAILAVAFLPVLIQGLQTAAVNSTRATANQLAHLQLETARSQGGDCSLITDLEFAAVSPVVDKRNVTLLTTRDAGLCPGVLPGTLTYTVTITRQDTGDVLATATTLIYVSQA